MALFCVSENDRSISERGWWKPTGILLKYRTVKFIFTLDWILWLNVLGSGCSHQNFSSHDHTSKFSPHMQCWSTHLHTHTHTSIQNTVRSGRAAMNMKYKERNTRKHQNVEEMESVAKHCFENKEAIFWISNLLIIRMCGWIMHMAMRKKFASEETIPLLCLILITSCCGGFAFFSLACHMLYSRLHLFYISWIWGVLNYWSYM